MEDFSDFLDLLKALKTKLYNPDKTDTAQYSFYREPCGLCGPYKEACEVNRTVMGIKNPNDTPSVYRMFSSTERPSVSGSIFLSLFSIAGSNTVAQPITVTAATKTTWLLNKWELFHLS